jgi:hypothetical protein
MAVDLDDRDGDHAVFAADPGLHLRDAVTKRAADRARPGTLLFFEATGEC